MAALIHYGLVIDDLNQIGYPRGTIYSQGVFEDKRQGALFLTGKNCSAVSVTKTAKCGKCRLSSRKLSHGDYDLVNFAFLMHHPDSFMTTYRHTAYSSPTALCTQSGTSSHIRSIRWNIAAPKAAFFSKKNPADTSGSKPCTEAE